MIYFYAENPQKLFADLHKHADWHLWRPDGASWGFGVANPKGDANACADKLTALGVYVFPGMRHPSPPAIPANVIAALAPHGVKPNDTTSTIAQKIATASGHPHLRPNFY